MTVRDLVDRLTLLCNEQGLGNARVVTKDAGLLHGIFGINAVSEREAAGRTDVCLDVMPVYTEIFRLRRMLEAAGVPFQSEEKFDGLCLYDDDAGWSATENCLSYGANADLIEIGGSIMTDAEREADCDGVLGHMTADDVFGRICRVTGCKGEIC